MPSDNISDDELDKTESGNISLSYERKEDSQQVNIWLKKSVVAALVAEAKQKKLKTSKLIVLLLEDYVDRDG